MSLELSSSTPQDGFKSVKWSPRTVDFRSEPSGVPAMLLLNALMNEARAKLELEKMRSRRSWRATSPLRSQRMARIIRHVPFLFENKSAQSDEASILKFWRSSSEYQSILEQMRHNAKEIEIGVLIHLHYHEMWEQVQQAIEALPGQPRVLITATLNAYSELAPKIEAHEYMEIIQISNSGRDMGAFFKAIDYIAEHEKWQQCKAILRIHGKRSPHLTDGEEWRQRLFDLLLQSAPMAPLAFESDSAIGVLGDLQSPYLNQELESDRKSFQTNWMPPDDFDWRSFKSQPFPVGGMFWFRPELINEYRKLNVKPEAFDSDRPGVTDGQTPHLLERMMGWWPQSLGFEVLDLQTFIDTSVLKFAQLHASDKGEGVIRALTESRTN